MGLFDFLFRRKRRSRAPAGRSPAPREATVTPPPRADGDALWARLAEAADDAPRLAALCRARRDEIRGRFEEWRRVPAAPRAEPARMEAYVRQLVLVAQTFAAHLGDPSLLDRLQGTKDSNPLLRWGQTLDSAEGLMDEARYADAKDVLTNLLIDVRGLEGSGVDAMLPRTLVDLGDCYFHNGEPAAALAPLQRARDLCERATACVGAGRVGAGRVGAGPVGAGPVGADRGAAAALDLAAAQASLCDVHRYLGQPAEAAAACRRLGAALGWAGRPADAARLDRRARRIEAAEPPNRVVVYFDEDQPHPAGPPGADGPGGPPSPARRQRFSPGQSLQRWREVDEVSNPALARMQFGFERNRPTLGLCRALTGRGLRAGGEGKFDEALALFRDAARADPHDPHCRYQEGLTLLYLERYADAGAAYESVERLAPGWFQCRSDAWVTRELESGSLDGRIFRLLRALEDSPDLAAEDKIRLAEGGLARYPDLALLRLLYGKALDEAGRRADAEAAFRRGLDAAPEPDVKTRLMVQLGLIVESPVERNRLLGRAKELNGNLIAAAMATIVLRATAGGE